MSESTSPVGLLRQLTYRADWITRHSVMEKIFGASEPGHSPLNGLGGPTMPRLNRILAEIRRGADADDALRDYVEVEARDLTGERLTRFMNEVYGRVHGLIQR